MLKKIYSLKIQVLIFFSASIFLNMSCDKEASYDVEGATQNIVYIKTQNWAPINMPFNTSYFNITKTPSGVLISNSTTVSFKFPVRCTQPATSDITVSLSADNSLVDEDFTTVPSGVNISMDKSSLMILKGNTISEDSVTISLNNDDLSALVENNTYQIPVRISAVSAGTISSNQNVANIILNTLYSNCSEKPTTVSGTLVTTRSAWTASLDVSLSAGSLSNLFDGNTRSYWYVNPAKACNLTVDLGENLTDISGIRIHSYSTSYSIYSASVYSSTDGLNWTSQGIANFSYATSYQYIQFYSPIESRYIKLNITSWKSSSYVIMSEFDVYRNVSEN